MITGHPLGDLDQLMGLFRECLKLEIHLLERGTLEMLT